MSPGPRTTLTLALAATLAGAAAPAPLAAADDLDDDPIRCFSWALTRAEIEAGAVSEIECYEADEIPQSRRASVDLAVLYDGTGGGTPANGLWPVTLQGASCTGASFNLAGTAWDNVVGSTRLVTCGNAKHYTGVFSGSNQLVSNTGSWVNMSSTLNNATTSIEYA